MDHVDWLLGENVAELKAVNPQGTESVRPTWSVVLRYELELRKEATRRMNLAGSTIADALHLARLSDDIRTRYLITPLALGGQRTQQEEVPRPLAVKAPFPKKATQPKERAGPPNQPERQQQPKKKRRQGNDNRKNKVRREDSDALHNTHSGKSICVCFPTPQRLLSRCRVLASTHLRTLLRTAFLRKVQSVQENVLQAKQAEERKGRQHCHADRAESKRSAQNTSEKAVGLHQKQERRDSHTASWVSEGGRCGRTHTAHSFANMCHRCSCRACVSKESLANTCPRCSCRACVSEGGSCGRTHTVLLQVFLLTMQVLCLTSHGPVDVFHRAGSF